MIKTAIKHRNEIALACLQLSRDSVFLKLGEEERLNLINEAFGVGEQIANWVIAEYDSTDPRKIAELMGVKIHGEEGKGKKKGEYRKKKAEIVVYRDALEKITEEVTVPHLSERLLRLLVANELFHHLEEVKVGKVYKKYPISIKLGPLTVKRYIPGLSEVAAQSFTRKLLELDLSPRVFAYLNRMMFSML